jgi:hypothetical protein
LALYVFSKQKSAVKAFKEQTASGALVFNEVVSHFAGEWLI